MLLDIKAVVKTGLHKGLTHLGVGGSGSFVLEELILTASKHHHGTGHGHGCEVRQVQVTRHAWYQHRKTHGELDVILELIGHGCHPAGIDRRLDAIIQSRQHHRPHASGREPHATNTVSIHLVPSVKVIQRANIIPCVDAWPGRAGSQQGTIQQVFVIG